MSIVRQPPRTPVWPQSMAKWIADTVRKPPAPTPPPYRGPSSVKLTIRRR